jgi:hypothetical protein
MKKQPTPTWPVGGLVRGFLLVSWLWFAAPWIWNVCRVNGEDCYHMTSAKAAADLKAIRQRLLAGQDERMQVLFPEGRLFSHSFYGFTLVNLAAANPQDEAFRRQVLTELEELIPHAAKIAAQKPFDAGAKLTPKGGIIAAGQVNLLRAGYAILGGKSVPIVEEYHAQSKVIVEAFDRSPVASVESYPGETWPVDNLAALESLRLHDVLYLTTYGRAGERWAQWMVSHVDSTTGMMNMQITREGAVVDGPRGCGLSWTLAFLPNIAPDLARQQYGLYREQWFRHPLGTTGIREFPEGRRGTFMDSDTGPIIFGLGTAATGFGIAAAKANHDTENLTGLLRALEICSFPTYSTDLSRSRFFGQVVLADELALWGQTLCRWDKPAAVPAAFGPAVELKRFWVVIVSLVAFGTLLAWLLGRWYVGAWRKCRREKRPLAGVHGAMLAGAVVVLAALLIVPAVTWLYALILLAALEVIERRISRRQRTGELVADETKS